MSDPFQPASAADQFDIQFAVPMVHRLRFTHDCFGQDFHHVLPLLEHAPGTPARVQVWIDSGLVDFDSSLPGRIEQIFADNAADIRLAGCIEILCGGEDIKNDPRYVDSVLRAINDANLDRRNYIFAIGGGALLDTVGYAAAIAHRGIRLVRFPTSTLAQADSGVGVKNAVNWFNKKNWKGTFACPWAVINDAKLLEGLPDRDFRCGFSEAVKVALLKSPSLFEFLVQHADSIAQREPHSSFQAIRQSVLLHLQHITRGGDPFEALEARPLDFGHWSAHKLEALTEYGLRHGEAVSIGVALDTLYSHLRLGLDRMVAEQTLDILRRLQLPVYHAALSEEAVFDGLEEFRQHLGGELTITLLSHLGQPHHVHEIDRDAMRQAIATLSQSATANASHGRA
ncbi:MAG: 3-dehydroquinate synthase [Pirellulaceae bacterium]|nr:3-dehydroquinate synthase [Pirellulaceae bacterium]